MSAILSTREVMAHLTIVEALDLGHMNKLSYQQVLNITWRPLESFAPRCNCRSVLRWSAWRDGVRWASCPGCGARWRECNTALGEGTRRRLQREEAR